MTGPQIVMISLYAASIAVTLARHGEPRTGEHNVWVAAFACCISASILWWGGFWN